MAIIAEGIGVLVFSRAMRTAEMKMPGQEYRMPVDLPMDLSGNFGRLRSTHFHAGPDIRTRQVTGHKIVAVADGYVSRIAVNVHGYGKVVYVTHPNGKTTVYAHLDRFAPRLENAWKRPGQPQKNTK
jgi:murein DD-endopeptidase MepM/ murein hydrolase activator NlpD